MTFIDIHVLQTVPPSNLNRDDTGSPKSALYGGVRRARISSQAWKKACRAAFETYLNRDELGIRTKRVVDAVVEQMIVDEPDLDRADAEAKATDVLTAAGVPTKAPKKRKGSTDAPTAAESDYLIFLSRGQIKSLADLARGEGKPSKKDAQQAADQSHGIEVSLFGRMVADAKDLTVDAACQVAHAISTHSVEDESDYFTAVDDLTRDDESGAGMIGTIEFNSSTLYRYATINIALLRENLGDDASTTRAVGAFIKAFALSMPTGKQNTFANRTVPDGVVVMIRDDQPVSLVGAFEDPVFEGESRVRASAERLVEQADDVLNFVANPAATFVCHAGSHTAALERLGAAATLDEVVTSVENEVKHLLSEKSPA